MGQGSEVASGPRWWCCGLRTARATPGVAHLRAKRLRPLDLPQGKLSLSVPTQSTHPDCSVDSLSAHRASYRAPLPWLGGTSPELRYSGPLSQN